MTIPISESSPVLKYGYATGRYIKYIGDGTDFDNYPDPIPMIGLRISFTPLEGFKKVSNPSALISKDVIVCSLDSQGFLIDPNGSRGVWLITGVYRVSYSLGGIATHDIEVLEDHTLNAPLDLIYSLPPSSVTIPPTQYAELSAILSQKASLPSIGIPNSNTFWRGDGAWAAPAVPIIGTGFPEGVVVAPIGTEYIDSLSTNGALKWIKKSGTGATGWKVSFGDSGDRNIAANFFTQAPEGSILYARARIQAVSGIPVLRFSLRYTGGALRLYINNEVRAMGLNANISPSEYPPEDTLPHGVWLDGWTYSGTWSQLYDNIKYSGTGTPLYMHGQWPLPQAGHPWPTVLPGTPI